MARNKQREKAKSLLDSDITQKQKQTEIEDFTKGVLEEFKLSEAEATKRITIDLPISTYKRWRQLISELETDGNKLGTKMIQRFLEAAGY